MTPRIVLLFLLWIFVVAAALLHRGCNVVRPVEISFRSAPWSSDAAPRATFRASPRYYV